MIQLDNGGTLPIAPSIIVHSTEPTHRHIQWQLASAVTAGPRLGDILLSTYQLKLVNICLTKENTLPRISSLLSSKELRSTIEKCMNINNFEY